MVADVGAKPKWVLQSECFTFWKNDVQSHLAEPAQRVVLDEMPGAYCYFASEWEADGLPIVVLQLCH